VDPIGLHPPLYPLIMFTMSLKKFLTALTDKLKYEVSIDYVLNRPSAKINFPAIFKIISNIFLVTSYLGLLSRWLAA
jgi:hypothetical protein